MRKPSWTADNREELLIACGLRELGIAHIRKENNKLRKFLRLHEWEYHDSIHIVEYGLTWTFKRQINGANLFFSWSWKQECGEIFWQGRLRASYDLMPHSKFYHPVQFIEIMPIFEEHKTRLGVLQNRLLTSLKDLTVVD